MRILVLEDNEDSAIILQYYLAEDYELIIKQNAVEALQFLEQVSPDMMLVDISLPDMDGIEFLKQANKILHKAIPAIALTAHASPEDRKLFLSSGFVEHVAKPITDKSVLIQAIEKVKTKIV